MGRDKALLPWDDTDLLGHALARLRVATVDVRILSGATSRYPDRGVPVEIDPAPDLGPMGGLLAALEAVSGSDVLLLGIDLPLITSALLTRLVELARGHDAVIPVSVRGAEPLCALYGAACREPVRRCVSRGDLKMTAFWPDIRVREVRPNELRAFGDPDDLFFNVNTPGDYERARVLSPRRRA
jgi:molybdopterin-guanine dinucleotide biosynthesis protein A